MLLLIEAKKNFRTVIRYFDSSYFRHKSERERERDREREKGDGTKELWQERGERRDVIWSRRSGGRAGAREIACPSSVACGGLSSVAQSVRMSSIGWLRVRFGFFFIGSTLVCIHSLSLFLYVLSMYSVFKSPRTISHRNPTSVCVCVCVLTKHTFTQDSGKFLHLFIKKKKTVLS